MAQMAAACRPLRHIEPVTQGAHKQHLVAHTGNLTAHKQLLTITHGGGVVAPDLDLAAQVVADFTGYCGNGCLQSSLVQVFKRQAMWCDLSQSRKAWSIRVCQP